MQKIGAIERRVSGTRLTVYTGVFVCLGLLIPYLTAHAFGLKGTVFLPMHIPVLLCGFICGYKRGMLCGIITPLLSSLLTGMPAAYPMLPIMTLELAMYGLTSGFLMQKGLNPIIALIIAMVVGRIFYGIMFYILLLGNSSLTIGKPIFSSLPVLSAFIIGIPGIMIQLAIIPAIRSLVPKVLRKNQ